MNNTIHDSELGKKSEYPQAYNPSLLLPIPRAQNRKLIGLTDSLPFYGFDIWQEYEISWLNLKGRPNVAIGQFIFSCSSPYLIESKSLKLYLHSLNNKPFASYEAVESLIASDLSNAVSDTVTVKITPFQLATPTVLTATLSGFCLDELDVTVNSTDLYLNPTILTQEANWAKEVLYSHLLKSNCPVTAQPDWATVVVNYQGPKINAEGLLKYIISFRNHAEFAENCVERIFVDIQNQCHPSVLTVSAFYTRRGGKDINPIRSTQSDIKPELTRILRQ